MAGSKSSELRALRQRAGLSLEKLARRMGYKGGSSIQRYESPEDYAKEFLPVAFVRKLAPALKGLGDPPIEPAEIWALAGVRPPDGGAMPLAPSTSRRDTRADFATRLHTVRSRFTSRTAFCKAAGLPAKRYRALSDGDADPSLDELIGISNAAGVSLDYLVLGLLPRPGFREEPPPAHPSPTIHDTPLTFRPQGE